MKHARKKFMVLLCISIMLFCSSAAYAMTSVSVINNFETGVVNIHLTESQINKEITETNGTNGNAQVVLPGDTLARKVFIANDGVDCYVRVKYQINDTLHINEKNIYGLNDKWVKADDGFYYYTEILPKDEEILVFEKITIPYNVSDAQGNAFKIQIDAGAIQSKNFTPDFTLAAPWGDVEIIKYEFTENYDVSTLKSTDSKSFVISFEGFENIKTSSDDFFVNFPYLMPGDRFSDSIKFENNSYNDYRLYFKTETVDDSELLKLIQLKITTTINNKTQVIYEGDLNAESLNKEILLGYIYGNENDAFDFEIYVPEELNNKYTLQTSSIKWIFTADKIYYPDPPKKDEDKEDPRDDENKPGDDTGKGKDNDNKNDKDDGKTKDDKEDNKNNPSNIPKTGDNAKVGTCITMMFLSLIMFIYSIYGLKKNKEKN